MNDLERVNKQSEEIDLLYLLRPVTKGIKKARHLMSDYFRMLRMNKWKLLAVILIFCMLALVLKFILPKGYRSEAIFASHGMNAGFCSLLINNLNQTTGKNENIHLLADQLKITPGIAEDIKSMEASPMKDSTYFNNKDSTVSLFRIVMIVHNKESVNKIQSGILNFLENNEYSLKRKDAHIKSLHAQNEDYQRKLASLDSLKKLVNSSVVPRSTGQGIILGEPVNPIGVYQAETEYYSDILKNNEDLLTSDNIEILQPFLIPDNYNYPNFRKLFLVLVLTGVAFGLVIAPFLKSKKLQPDAQS